MRTASVFCCLVIASITCVQSKAHAFPQVRCTSACGDLSGDQAVSSADYLYDLSETGQTLQMAGFTKWCLDSPRSGDGYVDVFDLAAWDFYLGDAASVNTCSDGTPDLFPGSEGSPQNDGDAVSLTSGTLVIAGKSDAGGPQQDGLFSFSLSSGGVSCGAAHDPASEATAAGFRGNSRLIADGAGNLHQLHDRQGLIRLADAAIAIVPDMLFDFGAQVFVGMLPAALQGGSLTGLQVADVAFSPTDASIAYVVPVWVSRGGAQPYRAAARLHVGGSGYWTVQRLYGLDPEDDPCANSTNPPGLECSAQNLREIEFIPAADGGASFLAVTAGRADNDNDWLLLYNEATGAEQRIHLSSVDPGLRAPVGMRYSAASDSLYIASALNNPAATSTQVFRLALTRANGNVTGVTLAATIDIDGMRTITDMVENPADGSLLVLGFTAPVLDSFETFDNNDPLFTTPKLAIVPQGASSASAITLSCGGLALPLSLAIAGGTTAGACCSGGTCSEQAYADQCTPFACNVADHLPPTFAGCYGDADGNGVVNAGDRGFISANIGETAASLVCRFDMDGNGTINAGDRGFVSANINLCQPLPDFQNGSGLNHGDPDTRFGTATFLGAGISCGSATCP